MHLSNLIKTIRPSFLVLSPVCVSLGLSTALATDVKINTFILMLIFLGAVFAHISVNMLNEYYDFKSGLDFNTKKTAFSGGSGALLDNPNMARLVLFLAWVLLGLTITIGFYLTFYTGIKFLPVGLVGLILMVTYTQWLNRQPLLCLIAPGLGFGILMVIGTHVILTGEYSLLSFLVSLVPFFLVNNLLLLNQYPDIRADAAAGRHTFPIAFGIDKSNGVYLSFSLIAYILITALVVTEYIPLLSIVAVTPILFSLVALWGAKKHRSDIGSFPKYLGANVVSILLTPLLLAMAIVVG